MFRNQKSKGKNDFLAWTIEKPRPGKFTEGWICGPMVGVNCHFNDGSKPCRREFSCGELPCGRCTDGERLKWQGYVPYLDRSGRRLVCLIGVSMEEFVASIPYGSPVRFHKGEIEKSPIVVTVKDWAGFPCPYLGKLQVPHSIHRWLFNLWKDQELEKWFFAQPELDESQLVKMVMEEQKPKVPEDLETAFQEFRKRKEEMKAEDANEGRIPASRLPKTSKNGTHS